MKANHTPTRDRHAPEHEHLLQAALAGDVPVDDARFQQRLRDCGECRGRYRELSVVRELLDHAGQDERETLAAIELARPVPGSELVAPFVRRALAERSARVRPTWTRRSLAWVASAAAGLVAVGWLVRWLLPEDGGDQRGILLGDTHEHGMSPRGPVREYTPLEWKLPLPKGGYYQLRIWDGGSDESLDPFVTMPRLEEPRWFAPPQVARTWPDKIRWEVRVYDATGVLQDSELASAERSPR